MTIEALIESKQSLYYILLLLVLGFSILFNSKKENRIKQTGLAKFYLISAVVFLVLFILNYAVSDTLKNLQASSSSNLGYLIFVYLLNKLGSFFVFFSEIYPILALLVVFSGLVSKFKIRFLSNDTRDKNVQFLYRGKAGTNLAKEKINFFAKNCYDKNGNVNDTGKLIAKISQNMAYTLIVLYVLNLIFKYYNIDLVFSSITLLFLGIVFLEVYFALSGSKTERIDDKNINNGSEFGNFIRKSSLNELLKLSTIENLEESKRMVHSKQEYLQTSSAIICEMPNKEEFKNINMKIMNGAFFENKKLLVICSSDSTAREYYSNLLDFNAEYDGKIMLKLLNSEDKMFTSLADIYVSTLENCFGNIKLLSRIDTIIIEDMDVIMQKKLELIRAFGSIVKMGNSNINYVIFTYMLQGIEATIKNLLLVKNVTWYSTENKQQPNKIELNIWDRKEPDIGDKILGKINKNLGSLIPLALIGVKRKLDRILVVSSDEPINFQLNELNAIRSLQEKEFLDADIESLNNKIELNTREKYFDYREKNFILTNDKNNIYEKIYKLSLINGMENNINIVSEQYLLRDYMISTYNENKTRLKHFLPYVPFEINNSKVVLYNLILQLTNFGVKETVISRIFNENGISITLGKGNNIRLISEKLNIFIKNEFDIDIDTSSYISSSILENKYVFDSINNNFTESEKIYVLDSRIFAILPNELFKKVNFTKDGFILNIEGEYAYNFYQKYLPGQKHCLNGHIYEIKNVIDTDNEVNAILEASINYDNNTYRQLRKVHILSDMIVSETKIHKYTNAIAKYMIGTIDFEVDTLGYFEFKNGVTMNSGEYRYVELDENNKKKVKRKHKGANVLKIEFSKSQIKNEQINTVFDKNNKDDAAEAIAFLLSEVLVTMLGENANYIQVKAIISPKRPDTINYNWIYPIEITDYSSENIEIYIFEDVQIERGLIDMIYKNLDNIFGIISDYLEWSLSQNITAKKEKRYIHYLRNFENASISLERYKLAKTLIDSTIIK